MGWLPLALRKYHSDEVRRLAARTSALLGNSAALLDRAFRQGTIPNPLLIALRAANQLAQTLLDQPSSPTTLAQRRALLAAGAQIRVMASKILSAQDASDPGSVGSELGKLVSRTLALIDAVAKDPATIKARIVSEEPLLKK